MPSICKYPILSSSIMCFSNDGNEYNKVSVAISEIHMIQKYVVSKMLYVDKICGAWVLGYYYKVV